VRAGVWPVRIDARVGEQRGLAVYARENVMPRRARRSMFGVRYKLVVPNSVVSLQPRSSARINTTFIARSATATLPMKATAAHTARIAHCFFMA